MRDTFLLRGKRKQLVDYLHSKGISDPNVLKAINKVPRHIFIESVFQDYAYEDRPFPIAAGQTISHPSTVAEQSQLLELKKGDKVLEIGTGCGYQTAVLIAMGAEVYTIERQKDLFDYSKDILEKLRLTPRIQSFGDGFQGLPVYAPFDKILVTCGAATLPKQLLKQLKTGGFMVIPLGKEDEQTLTRYKRVDENSFEKEEFGLYQFVPMLKDVRK